MNRGRKKSYLISAVTLALLFAAFLLVFRDALPEILTNLRTVPFRGVLLLLVLGFAYEGMEAAVGFVLLRRKKKDVRFADALGIMASEYVLHKISVLLYATAALLLGGGWLRESASGLSRYILIGYGIGALIVLVLTLLYTWDKVLDLVLLLFKKLPDTPKWNERREKWGSSLVQLNTEARKVLLVPSVRVRGIAVSLLKLFVLYSIPYLALRLAGCTALSFAEVQLLSSLMLLITSALPNVAGMGPMEFAFLLLFSPWAGTAAASSALVLYRVATYFFPFLLSVITFLREEKRSLKGFDAQGA